MKLYSKYPPANRGTVIVWGLLASYPFGGMTWQVLHYVAGLRRLGFDVWYVEDSDRYVLDTMTFARTLNCSSNVEYLSHYMKLIGLDNRWIFRVPHTKDICYGARDFAGLMRLYQESDAVFNLCGAQELLPYHSINNCLVMIQTDPVLDQIKVVNGNVEKIEELDAYDYLFTYGENLGATDCFVPIERYQWHFTRPPVCVDWWETDDPPGIDASLTTVANWKHTGKDVEWEGEKWRWSKHYEFRRFISLPSRSKLPLEIAVGWISDNDRSQLNTHGWRIVPSIVDPNEYRDYIRGSIGEFTVAKEQYVRPRTGWFSDRSVCYLSSGRPVIMQDTAFGKFVPTGEGLFSFSTEEDALAAIDSIAKDYNRHSTAAREIAREYFEAKHVLTDLLSKLSIL